MNPDLHLLAINLTRRCNLACRHCYLDAGTLRDGAATELSCEEVCRLLAHVAERSTRTMVVLTGGEPLLRPDLETIVEYGSLLGLTMLVGTNGTALTPKRVASLKQAGLLGLGISIDSLIPERHDAFRGKDGCLDKTMAGIRACREQGLPFQIHFTVAQFNSDEIPAVIAFARASGAHVLNVFFMVCVGRAQALSDLSPSRYETILAELIEAQRRHPDIIIRPRCAPHFKRLAHQQHPEAAVNRISGLDGDGCIAGVHYCRVDPHGRVTPCPYTEIAAGNIRDADFMDIWDKAGLFRELRNPQLNGRCGLCEFRQLCGGCRARAAASGGTLFDSDPLCDYRPAGGEVIAPLRSPAGTIAWSESARKRLERVPGFLRAMVKARAEALLLETGETEVDTVHLETLMARRFGGHRPGHPHGVAPDGT